MVACFKQRTQRHIGLTALHFRAHNKVANDPLAIQKFDAHKALHAVFHLHPET